MGNRVTLDRVSQVAFIAMCLVIAAVGVQRLSAGNGRAGPPPPFETGTRLALHPELAAGEARASLLLALSTNCQYCTASMPFYRRLAELDAARTGRLRLSIVSLQEVADMRAYLDSHHLRSSAIVQAREAGVPLRATPTLVLIDGGGAVAGSWSGQLSPADEERLVKAIQKLAG